MGRRKPRARNAPSSPRDREPNGSPGRVAATDEVPHGARPPRPNRLLLGISIACFLIWFSVLLYAAVTKLAGP